LNGNTIVKDSNGEPVPADGYALGTTVYNQPDAKIALLHRTHPEAVKLDGATNQRQKWQITTTDRDVQDVELTEIIPPPPPPPPILTGGGGTPPAGGGGGLPPAGGGGGLPPAGGGGGGAPPTPQNLTLNIPFIGGTGNFQNQAQANAILNPILNSLLSNPANSITLNPNTARGNGTGWVASLLGPTGPQLLQMRSATLNTWFTSRGVNPNQLNFPTPTAANFNTTINVTGTAIIFPPLPTGGTTGGTTTGGTTTGGTTTGGSTTTP